MACTIVGDGHDIIENEINVLHQLNLFRQFGKCCDVVFVIGNKRYPCHRCVLMTTAKYFDSMFSSNFSEWDKKEVRLEGVEEKGFEILLDYIYGGKINLKRRKLTDILSLLAVADYMGIEYVITKCLDIVQSLLNMENALEICSFVVRYKIDVLYLTLKTYLLQNFITIVKNGIFFELPFVIIKELVFNDCVKIDSEEEIFEAIDKWIHHNMEDRLVHVDELVKSVRFSFISEDFLLSKLATNNLLARKIRPLKTSNNGKLISFQKRISKCIYLFGQEKKSLTGQDKCLKVMTYNGNDFEPVSKMSNLMLSNPFSLQIVISDNCFYNFICHPPRTNQFFRYDIGKNEKWINLRTPPCVVCGYNIVASQSSNCLYLNTDTRYTDLNFNFELYCYFKDIDQWFPVNGNCDRNNRINSQCLVDYNGAIFMFGGVDNFYKVRSNVVLFDPRIGRTVERKSMPKKRTNAIAATLDKKIYISGGINKCRDTEGIHTYKSVLVYEVRMNKWHTFKSTLYPKYAHNLFSYDAKLWAVDGIFGNIEKFSFDFGSWTMGPRIDDYFGEEVRAVVF